MPKWIPERPSYKKERRTVGFMALAAFLALFLCRLLGGRLPFFKTSYLFLPFMALVSLLLPAAVYLLYRGQGYGTALRLRAPAARYTPLLIASTFALFSGTLLLSRLTGGSATLGSTVTAFDTAKPQTVWETVLFFLGAAVLPAILEELFFRGIVTAEYERRGAVRAILMSAALFSLLHFDPKNILPYLFAGVLLSLVLFATNSLVATMAVHAIYNASMLFSQHYLNALYEYTGTVQLYLFIFTAVLLVSLLFFTRSCARIYRARDERGLEDPRRAVPYNVQFYTTLDALGDPTVILCLGLAIAGFVLF